MKPSAAAVSLDVPLEVPLSDIKARLRAVALRATGPRITVIRYLLERAAPVSHAELAHDLESTGLDRATLYRNLIDLTRAGLVHRQDLGDHVWRFELKWSDNGAHIEHHPHFFCVGCGEVRCLPDVHVTIVAGDKAPATALQSALEVQLRGRCERC